jgi:hypothetical protein
MRAGWMLVAAFAAAPAVAGAAQVQLGTPMDITEEVPSPKVMVTMTPADEVPTPSGTASDTSGTATFTLDATAKTIAYTLTVNNLTGPPIAAHIHRGAPGVAGPVIVPLDEAALTGTTPALSDSDLQAFLTGQTYVNVHTTANPSGEIRAQIVPPTGSSTFTFDPDTDTLQYSITPQHLSGAPVAAHLHLGPPGTAGAVVVPLSTSLSGSVSNIIPQTVSDLYDGKLYVNVHTALNPNGEIRGQVSIVGPAGCTCETAGTKGKYLKCIKKAIAALSKTDRKSKAVKALKAAAKQSTCGRKKVGKKTIACCLPQTPVGEIVVGRICAAVSDKACTKKGGTSLGSPSTCVPTNPCTPPASPSGAFVDGPR